MSFFQFKKIGADHIFGGIEKLYCSVRIVDVCVVVYVAACACILLHMIL